MTETHCFMALTSKDKKTLVEVFTSPDTGLIEGVYIAQRAHAWHSWGPLTKAEKVDY